jgi:hypothetical protein
VDSLRWFVIILVVVVLCLAVLDIYLYRKLLLAATKQAGKDSRWEEFATGVSGNIELEKSYLRVAQEAYNLFCRKNHDYGTNNLSTGWLTGIAVRLGDKVSRLWNLVGLGKDNKIMVKDEAVKDTMIDVANYGIVGYLMATKQWPKAKIADLIGKNASVEKFHQIYSAMDNDQQVEALKKLLEE